MTNTETWDHTYQVQNEPWLPVYIAKQRFRLTKAQIDEAISRKLLRTQEYLNPHSERMFTLVSLWDLEKHLRTIRSFSKGGF